MAIPGFGPVGVIQLQVFITNHRTHIGIPGPHPRRLFVIDSAHGLERLLVIAGGCCQITLNLVRITNIDQ